jgi:predicted aspartyl protease
VPLTTTIIKYTIHLAAVLLVPSLIATSACSEPDLANTAQGTPTGMTLLAGAKSAQDNFHVTTEFRLKQNTILVDARQGGAASSESFVVDSGAPMTIAPGLARELGLQSLATIALAGPEGGNRVVPVTRIPTLNIAGLDFEDIGAVIDWVEPPNQLACLSTAGLMGASLLQAAIWQIDFLAGKITITNSLAELPGLADAMQIPFKRSDASGSPRIDVGVSGAEDVSLLIDLGFNGSIAIPIALLQESGDRILEQPVEVGQSSATVFGQQSSQTHIAMLRELRVGDLRLQDFPVVTGATVSDFHIGIEFLRHFRVTIDWLNNNLYLEPMEQANALYSEIATYGISPQLRDDQLVVGAIWQTSAADRAGMAPGDQLLAIDGRDVSSADFASLCEVSEQMGLFGETDAPVSVTWMHKGQQKTAVLTRAPLLPAAAMPHP